MPFPQLFFSFWYELLSNGRHFTSWRPRTIWVLRRGAVWVSMSHFLGMYQTLAATMFMSCFIFSVETDGDGEAVSRDADRQVELWGKTCLEYQECPHLPSCVRPQTWHGPPQAGVNGGWEQRQHSLDRKAREFSTIPMGTVKVTFTHI